MEDFNDAATNKAQDLSQMIHCLNFHLCIIVAVSNMPIFFAIKRDAHFLISHTQTLSHFPHTNMDVHLQNVIKRQAPI